MSNVIEETIKQYLKDNLSLELSVNEEFGPIQTLCVTIKIDDTVIEQTSVDLPEY